MGNATSNKLELGGCDLSKGSVLLTRGQPTPDNLVAPPLPLPLTPLHQPAVQLFPKQLYELQAQ